MTAPTAALVVRESCWGNTAAVADAIAEGLRDGGVDVTVVDAAGAPIGIDPAVRLVLIGAPTHNMRLPTAASRRSAAERGAPATGTGVAEWIARARFGTDAAVLTFDTHIASRFSGSAARHAAQLLRRSARARVGERFVVAGEPPRLTDGELDRARAWGGMLAADLVRGR
ncbi:MAG: flavodoxin/nitric oxide synthase [Propionicimonas sp.]|uniref:flavodoxin/nitric oxide synthase n=1 Tax=Propionicimonas sp. TaxID=1955623 RepID=UPI003D14F28F